MKRVIEYTEKQKYMMALTLGTIAGDDTESLAKRRQAMQDFHRITGVTSEEMQAISGEQMADMITEGRDD